MISEKALHVFRTRLALLKFFPTDSTQSAALTEVILEFATSDEQLDWLAKRMLKLYPEWPGPYELRAVFCSKFRPKDGYSPVSAVYMDGIPSERMQVPQIAAPESLKLPPGHTETADPELETAIHALAEMKRIPPVAGLSLVSKTLEEILTAPQDRPELPPPTPQVITQEDIDKAVEELRQKKLAATGCLG